MRKNKMEFLEIELKRIDAHCAVQRRKNVTDIAAMMHEAALDADPANMYMRLYFILSSLGQDEFALEMQAQALQHRAIFRITDPVKPSVRLLALMSPGDMTDNAPLDYLLEGHPVRLDLLFVSPGQELPSQIPDHDLVFVGMGESEKNSPTFASLMKLRESWPRPWINAPEKLLNCRRDRLPKLLEVVPGLLAPACRRWNKQDSGEFNFPLTIRPIDTHGGKGLEKLNCLEDFHAYLSRHGEIGEFYIADYIDYQSKDGFFRKARVAIIDRIPYACHLAISPDWIVHYIPSGMEHSQVKRAEEQSFMEDFEDQFARRHAKALLAIADLTGLDYIIIDCWETGAGELLLFEADGGGWIHAIDPAEIFPYKAAVMQKAFDGFEAMLLKKSRA
jgi:hypothetical protein